MSTLTGISRKRLITGYTLCIGMTVYGIVALLGTFVFFDPVCLLMLMIEAGLGAVGFSYLEIRRLRGKLRVCAFAAWIAAIVAVAVWSAEIWAIMFRIAFDELFGFR